MRYSKFLFFSLILAVNFLSATSITSVFAFEVAPLTDSGDWCGDRGDCLRGVLYTDELTGRWGCVENGGYTSLRDNVHWCDVLDGPVVTTCGCGGDSTFLFKSSNVDAFDQDFGGCSEGERLYVHGGQWSDQNICNTNFTMEPNYTPAQSFSCVIDPTCPATPPVTVTSACTSYLNQLGFTSNNIESTTRTTFNIGSSKTYPTLGIKQSSSCDSTGVAVCECTSSAGSGVCEEVAGDTPTYTCIDSRVVTGTINVTSNIAGAKWTIGGRATLPAIGSDTGTSKSYISQPDGSYTIYFEPVSGYITPASQTFSITNQGGVINFTGTYIEACGGASIGWADDQCTFSANPSCNSNMELFFVKVTEGTVKTRELWQSDRPSCDGSICSNRPVRYHTSSEISGLQPCPVAPTPTVEIKFQ